MDNKTLPIILQHVRELAEVNLGGANDSRYKIITPFPPVGNDFFDFNEQNLGFTDSETDANAAIIDTINAYDFFISTNNLYYNYSYGVKSMEYFLSDVCKKFYRQTIKIDETDNEFNENFDEKSDAFFLKYKRNTIGDLGNSEFYYTSLSPIQWNNSKIILTENDIIRLKGKALDIYNNIENINNEFVKTLLAEVNNISYSKIEYELGFFDVIRPWIDPQLFESNSWKFTSDNDVMYGENDNDFVTNDVKLCYSQRFYIIKSYTGTAPSSPKTSQIEVRDHRNLAKSTVIDHRTRVRNNQLNKNISNTKLTNNNGMEINIPIDPTGKYIWVPSTPSTPGHWERRKSKNIDEEQKDEQNSSNSIYKIAAVIGRTIPRKPSATAVNQKIPPVIV